MRQVLSLIFVFLSILISLSGVELTDEEEQRLPFFGNLIEDFQPSDASKMIGEGTRFILLRPLNDGYLLADFPRIGVYPVAIDSTDVMQNLAGVETQNVPNKYVPRMSYFFANKIISGESGWQLPLRSHIVNKFSRWIILYGRSDEIETKEAVWQADQFYRELSTEERDQTCLVYLDPLGNKQNINAIAEEFTPLIQSMPGYLSRGYCHTLFHLDDNSTLPVVVELLSSGRVVSRHEGLGEIRTYFVEKE